MKQKKQKTNVITRGLMALVAAYFLTAPAHAAETKIAVIDLKRVFDNYWKKKQAQVQIDDQKADFEKKYKGMSDDYQKANEEYKKLMEGVNDQAVSDKEREQRKSAAEKKLLEIKEIDQTANLYRKNATENLDIQSRRMAGNILKDIRELIDAKAKAAGYSLVIDTQSSADAAIVLYTNGQNDITEEILLQLNAGAPSGLAKPDEDKEKPNPKNDEKKEGRKK